MRIKIMPTRHSPFYSPFLACYAGGFLEKEGIDAELRLPKAGENVGALLRKGEIDVSQSAVSASWAELEKGEDTVPIHFAQINQRDGFILVGREPDPHFTWGNLVRKTIIADHGKQPYLMLRWAARINNADWSEMHVIDAGSSEAMEAAFRAGDGDYIHLQAGVPQQLEAERVGFVVTRVGEGLKPLAFSSVSAYRPFLESDAALPFLRAFAKAKDWVRQSAPGEVAGVLKPLFPALSEAALSAAIRDCQTLGCWDGGNEITPEMYAEAERAFLWGGGITRQHPYESVCVTPE
jgi:NitT/TauT family transport system substrate-binding protein